MNLIWNSIISNLRRFGSDVSVVTPADFVVTDISSTSIDFSWTSRPWLSYVLERASNIDFSDAVEVYVGSGNSFADTVLDTDTLYFYRLKSVRGEESSIWVELVEKTFTTTFQAKLDYGRSNFSLANLTLQSQRIENALISYLQEIGALTGVEKAWFPSTDEDFSRINVMSPGSNTFVLEGGVSLVNESWVGNGGYINTGWKPSTGTKYTLNECGILLSIKNNVQTGAAFRVEDSANVNTVAFVPRNVDNRATIILNANSGLAHDGQTNGDGRWHMRRVSSAGTDAALFRNGTQISLETGFSTSSGRTSQDLVLLARNRGGVIDNFSDVQIGYFIVGASLVGLEQDIDFGLEAFEAKDLNFFFDTSYEFGDLAALHSEESVEELNSRRADNYAKFKLNFNSQKIGGEIQLPDERLELYVPETGYMDLHNGESITLKGSNELVLYPFAPRQYSEDIIKMYSGSHLVIDGLDIKKPLDGKYEVYRVVLKKGGNNRLIELLNDVRPGFWDNLQVGQTLFYGWAYQTEDRQVTIDSWDEVNKTITISTDIVANVSSDMSGFYVAIATYFEETISEADYETYGKYWYAIDSTIGNAKPGYDFLHIFNTGGDKSSVKFIDTTIDGFLYGINANSKNLDINIEGDCVLKNCGIAVANFTPNAVSATSEFNSVTGSTLTVENNGYPVIGGKSTSANLFGSGCYISPNIEVDFQGDLILLNNRAAAFRQYSASGFREVLEGQSSYFSNVQGSNNNEFDLMTSDSIPTIIDYADIPHLRIGGNLTVNGGAISAITANHLAEPSAGEVVNIFINNCALKTSAFSYSPDVAENLTVIYNNCTFKSTLVTTTSSFIIADGTGPIDRLEIINCSYDYDELSGVSLIGEGTVRSTALLRLTRFNNILIDGLTVGPFVATLFNYSSDFTNPVSFELKNFTIECDRFLSNLAPNIPVKAQLRLADGISNSFSGSSKVFNDAEGITISCEGFTTDVQSYTGNSWSATFSGIPDVGVPITAIGILRKLI